MEQAEIERLLMKPTARRRLGKYVLLGRLGHGGMGKIYLAYLPGPAGIEKLLVIKRLHSHLTGDEVLVSNFLDEARLSMALNHPNIVHTYDVGEVDGRYFMVMEHIDGQNLGVLLRTAKRSGHYPSSEVWAGMFIQVLEGLHAAHIAVDARGRPLNIIHRDVSPQNVLLTYDGTPKLVDFGIAKAAMRINETDAGVLKGKYAYMSPEQCEGHELEAGSDVFSAGIVLWEMLAGRRLYKSDSVLRSVERILHEAPISPVKVNAECDPDLAKVVLKALQKRTSDRFSTAEEFRDALDECLRLKGSRFRKSDVRDLMHTVFGDVMRRQRQVLDRCLAGDIPLDDPGDSESGQGQGRGFDGESASDLRELPAISIDLEPTTPSQVRPSPLVTGEGESRLPQDPVGGSQRSTRAERKTPTIAPDAMTEAFAPNELVGEGGGRRSRGPLAAGIVLLVFAAAGAGLWLSGALDGWLAARPGATAAAGDSEGPPPGTATGTPGAQAPSTGAPSRESGPSGEPGSTRDAPAARPGSPDSAGPPAAGEGRQPNDGRLARAPADDVDRDDDDDDEVDRNGRRGRRPPDGKKKGRRGRGRDDARTRSDAEERADDRRDEGAPAATPPPDEPRAPPPDERPPERTPERAVERTVEKPTERPTSKPAATGLLTLDTQPWAEVYLDGKKLGNTPLVRAKVPAGELTLVLKNPELGIERKYFVVIRPGEETRKKLGL